MKSRKDVNNIKKYLRNKYNMSDKQIDDWCERKFELNKTFEEKLNSMINRELHPKIIKKYDYLKNNVEITKEQKESYLIHKQLKPIINQDIKEELSSEEDDLKGY